MPLPLAASSLGRRAVFAAAAAAFVAAAAPAAPVVAADLLTDYATDTKDLILRQRGLLREVRRPRGFTSRDVRGLEGPWDGARCMTVEDSEGLGSTV
jgi:hypothetical protein